MTYRGYVKNGLVVLDGGAVIEEGTLVEIHPVDPAEELPTLAERFKDVIGKAVGLPNDMAENHDHYLHGLPKRSSP